MKQLKNICLIVLFSIGAILLYVNKSIKLENKILKNNQATLLDSIKHYKVSDSLNAARITELQLSTKELIRYYPKETVKIIKEATKHNKLETVEAIKTENKNTILTALHDTVIIDSTKLDTVFVDTLKSFSYFSDWTDVSGIIYPDTALLQINNREELLVTISKQKKKFLGIRLPGWLFGYKQKQIDVVSKNPNTTIKNVDFIQIR